jgi:hypothetical protein
MTQSIIGYSLLSLVSAYSALLVGINVRSIWGGTFDRRRR